MNQKDFEYLMALINAADEFNNMVLELKDLRNYHSIFALLDYLKVNKMSLKGFIDILQEAKVVICENLD